MTTSSGASRSCALLLLVSVGIAFGAGGFHIDGLPGLLPDKDVVGPLGATAAPAQGCPACALSHAPATTAPFPSAAEDLLAHERTLRAAGPRTPDSTARLAYGSRAPPASC